MEIYCIFSLYIFYVLLLLLFYIVYLYFSDKKSGTLVLICELMDMNIYELIRGMYTQCLLVRDYFC